MAISPLTHLVELVEPDRPLNESDMDSDPHEQFRNWLREATDAGEFMPTAMAVATTNAAGAPSVRMIQLDDVDMRGFVFQTHLDSPKAHDLKRMPYAAATFFWPRFLRAVRLSGRVESLTRDEVAIYFAAAPSQVQAMLRACHQGQVIADRATLERGFAAAVNSADTDVPSHWGGYRIVLDWIEFWQGRQNWLQDRLRYTRVDSGWVIQRLMP